MGVETEPWWEELVTLRNEMSLRELAEKYGASAGEISLAMKNTGVRRQPRQSPGGTKGASSAPKGSGTPRPGSKDARLDPFRDLMGTISDSEIANRAGVSMRTVASYRRRHDIAAYMGRGTPKKRFRRSRIDPFVDLVGKLPDRLVAEKAGVTLNAVRNYRTNRGIPSSRAYARSQREAAAKAVLAAPAEEPKHAPTRSVVAEPARVRDVGSFAWRVRFGSGLDGVVTAASAAEAATLGAAHDPEVVSVERVGRLL